MRSEDEMMDLIFKVAQGIPSVKAIALNGSKVYQKKNKDPFQDYDIVYFVEDDKMKNLIDHRQWLKLFGEILVMQTPMIEDGTTYSYEDRFNFLMMFLDGNRIDLGLCPLSKIQQWVDEDPVAKVLKDPYHLLPEEKLLSNDLIYQVNMPNQQKFQDVCNEFWWVNPYVVKGILRDEYFYALDHFHHIQESFLELLSWQLASINDGPLIIGKNFKHLKDYIDEDFYREILSWQNNGSIEQLAIHLLAIQVAFSKIRRLFLDGNPNYSYNEIEETNVMNYTREKLGKF